jgi:hypothetical protein
MLTNLRSVQNLRGCPIQVSAEQLHLGEIARIVLPTDWAMCEVLWYGMVLVAHPHSYPHTMHTFCGH